MKPVPTSGYLTQLSRHKSSAVKHKLCAAAITHQAPPARILNIALCGIAPSSCRQDPSPKYIVPRRNAEPRATSKTAIRDLAILTTLRAKSQAQEPEESSTVSLSV